MPISNDPFKVPRHSKTRYKGLDVEWATGAQGALVKRIMDNIEELANGEGYASSSFKYEEVTSTPLTIVYRDDAVIFGVTGPIDVNLDVFSSTEFESPFVVSFVFENALANVTFVDTSDPGDPLTIISENDYVFAEGKGGGATLAFLTRNKVWIDGDLGVTP